MKKVLNFFSKQDGGMEDIATAYRFKEPTLNPLPQINPQHAQQHTQSAVNQPDPADESEHIPTGYAEIVAFFQKTVEGRKSPYNALVKAADRLKEFIPDETSRLQAAMAICGDQWPPDVLSLAISAHIADIDLARKKAKSNTHSLATERAAGLRDEADQIKKRNSKIMDEIHALNESIAKLEAALNANNATLASLNEQIRIADADANSVNFLDQAAENIKNDLLARKVILGLP
jgi:hypothetical protein